MKQHALIAAAAAVFAGTASAGPVTTLIDSLAPASLGGSATGTPSRGALQLPTLPLLGVLALPVSSSLPVAGSGLPGLDGLIGITVLKKGADGSGYGDVLDLDSLPVIGQQLHGVLLTPLLGAQGDGGLLDLAVLDGNGTATAGPDGLLGAALISGSRTGNGGAMALGILNGNDTGNGRYLGLAILSGASAGSGQLAGIGILNRGALSGTGGMIGIGALSGTGSGSGSLLGIGLLNTGDGFHLCVSGQCVSPGNYAAIAGMLPVGSLAVSRMTIAPGVVIGGNSDPVTSSNALLNVGALSGANSGTGGAVGVGALAGGGSGKGSVTGVCVLCGDGSGKGPLGVAALSGADAGSGLASSAVPMGVAGVGVLNKDRSGTGGVLGVAALSGNDSGHGPVGVAALSGSNAGSALASSAVPAGIAGVGVLNQDRSGTGGVVGLAAINGNDSGTGAVGASVLGGKSSGTGSAIGAGVINGDGSGNGGVLGAGVLGGVASGNGGTLGTGVLNGAASGNGGTIGAGVLNGAGSANGGTLGAGVLNTNRVPSDNTAASGRGGTLSAGILNASSTGGVPGGVPGSPNGPVNTGNANVPTALGDLFASNTATESLCGVVTRDASGKVTQSNALPCNRLKAPKVVDN